MPKVFLSVMLAAALASLTQGPGLCQQQLSPGDAAALRAIAAQAGIIFAGQVLSVDWPKRQDKPALLPAVGTAAYGQPGSGAVVTVRFRVDAALRGCADGDVFTLREWAGLWSAQAPRYLPGARLLMLLPPAGPAGLSAPVGGTDGAIPLTGTALPPRLGAGGAVSADLADGEAPSATSPGESPRAERRRQVLGSLAPELRWVRARADTRADGRAAHAAPARTQAPAGPASLSTGRLDALFALLGGESAPAAAPRPSGSR